MSQDSVDIVVKRIVQSPIEVLWDIWTKPEHIKEWYGPKDFTGANCKVDLKVGGKVLLGMHAPDYMGGKDNYSVGEFVGIKPMERLEFTQSLSDNEGNVIDPASIGMPEFPDVTTVIVEFKKLSDDFTEITVTQQGFPPNEQTVFAYAGWQQSMDKLSSLVEKSI